ncbi:MAG TPA: hypothetical protein VGF97_15720 [Rhizomicrobium sp.]|jgi:hypothetical protein
MSEPQFSRENIYAALFALVGASAPFVTKTRRIREYSDVDQSLQPALLQVELGENWEAPVGKPPLVTLQCRLLLYCESNDPVSPVSTQMNGLLDAVMGALAWTQWQNYRQTLGGLVSHARIAGEITIAEGLSGQSEAIVPVEILVNA